MSMLSKLLEKHVHIHLDDYLRKYSCNTALTRLRNVCLKATNKSEVSGVVFLDPKKVLDLVDHDMLFKKLAVLFFNSCLSHPFKLKS